MRKVQKLSFISPRYIFVVLLLLTLFFIFNKIDLLLFQMEWDDYWVVVNEYTTRGFTFYNISRVLTEFYHGQYSPVNQLYYIVIHSIFGYDATSFHVASIILHILNCIAVQWILFKISYNGLFISKYKASVISWIAVIIFAVHPINIEPIAWISASKIPLYSLFYLISIALYIEYILQRKLYFFVLSIAFFIFSFGAKEQAVTYPICIMLIDWVFNVKKSKGYFIRNISLLAISIVMGIVTIYSQGNEEQAGTSYNIFERVLLAFYSLGVYITQAILPIKLSYLYPFPFEHNEPIPVYVYAVLVLFFIITYFGWQFLKERWLCFGILFFVLHLLVGLHIIGLGRYSVVADRYAYVSLIGYCYIAGYVIVHSIDRNFKFRKYLYLFWFCYIFGLGMYSKLHLQVWIDSKSLKAEFKRNIEQRTDYPVLKEKFENHE